MYAGDAPTRGNEITCAKTASSTFAALGEHPSEKMLGEGDVYKGKAIRKFPILVDILWIEWLSFVQAC